MINHEKYLIQIKQQLKEEERKEQLNKLMKELIALGFKEVK